MNEQPTQKTAPTCSVCEKDCTISLGLAYRADGIYRKFRCKWCGNLFVQFIQPYKSPLEKEELRTCTFARSTQ